MTRKQILAIAIAAFTASAGSAAVAADDALVIPTPAAKTDTGLGELPAFSEMKDIWVYAQPAEHRDSGLGSMPNVSDIREPWLFAQPAQKIDSGLGEIASAPAPRATLQAALPR